MIFALGKKTKFIYVFIILTSLVLSLFLFVPKAEADDFKVSCLQDLDGKRIGIVSGSIYEKVINKLLPEADVCYYNSSSDGASALLTDKIDAFVMNNITSYQLCLEQPAISILNESLIDENYGFLFPKTDKGKKLCTEFNEFVKQCRDSGVLDELFDKWVTTPASQKKEMDDYSTLPDYNGTLTLFTSSNSQPFEYIQNDKMIGYEIELATLFCKNGGYGLKIEDASFEGLLSAVSVSKADMGCMGISITEEKKQTYNMSDAVLNGKVIAMVADKHMAYGSAVPIESFAKFNCIDDFNGTTIGLLSGGGIYDIETKERLPEAKILYFQSFPDSISSLRSGKIDGYAGNEVEIQQAMYDNPDIAYINEYLQPHDFGFMFGKNDSGKTLCGQMNEYITELTESGKLDELQKKWFESDSRIKKEILDYSSLPATNGTLSIATSTTSAPFEYIYDNQITGYEIEILAEFCKKYGYAMKIKDMTWDSIITAVISGKYDIGASHIIISDERKEEAYFSDPIYISGAVFATLAVNAGENSVKAEATSSDSFLTAIVSGFEKTFIYENRWQLFVRGIIVTLIITCAAVALGTVLGFAIFMSQRKGNRFADALCRFFCWLIGGMPIVVLLMILFYLIFGSSSLDGTVISVIGFTLVFASGFIGNLKMGTGAIDRGQTEAAYALGYSDKQTFRKIILPQAVRHFMPSYKNNIVSLLKGTAVVGYIAVQDLTKVSDIIRSRTYEAFFPLIVTAVLYFIIAYIIISIVKNIESKKNQQKHKSKILKGLNT